LHECIWVDADFDVFAEDCYFLTETKAVAKFGDCCVALDELRNRRWGQEPISESIFAHAGAGEGEKFEEAGLAKEVEVSSVETRVNVDSDSRSGLASIGLVQVNPAIFDSSESVAIEIDGAFGAGALARNLCMKDRDSKE
jgi:hypothetical protein